jgi:hypothetical protein
VWRDLRFGFRQLCRARASAAVTALMLVIGIGANTLRFSAWSMGCC